MSEWNDMYQASLEDPRWLKTVAPRVKKRDNHTCRRCARLGEEMQAHHLFYIPQKTKDGNVPLPAYEYPDAALVTLCQPCHEELSTPKQHAISEDNFPDSNPNDMSLPHLAACLCVIAQRVPKDAGAYFMFGTKGSSAVVYNWICDKGGINSINKKKAVEAIREYQAKLRAENPAALFTPRKDWAKRVWRDAPPEHHANGTSKAIGEQMLNELRKMNVLLWQISQKIDPKPLNGSTSYPSGRAKVVPLTDSNRA